MITAINKATGEIVELPTDTPDQITQAWLIAQQYEKTATALKDQLKKLVPTLITDKGVSEPIGNYIFRQSPIQRMNYNKSIMREVLDPDVYDVLTKPDKPAIDKYLKDNLAELGDISTTLRQSMTAEGMPYTVIKLEKLS